MGFSDWSNNHPKTTAVGIGVCVAVGIGAFSLEILRNRHPISTSPPDHYYTVDDGKTFFKASQSNVAPFEYQGQIAVRACVFDCGGHQFVGYMERYTPEARQKELGPQRGSPDIEINGRELKRPGDAKWVSSSDRMAMINATRVSCPDGSSEVPMPVEP